MSSSRTLGSQKRELSSLLSILGRTGREAIELRPSGRRSPNGRIGDRSRDGTIRRRGSSPMQDIWLNTVRAFFAHTHLLCGTQSSCALPCAVANSQMFNVHQYEDLAENFFSNVKPDKRTTKEKLQAKLCARLKELCDSGMHFLLRAFNTPLGQPVFFVESELVSSCTGVLPHNAECVFSSKRHLGEAVNTVCLSVIAEMRSIDTEPGTGGEDLSPFDTHLVAGVLKEADKTTCRQLLPAFALWVADFDVARLLQVHLYPPPALTSFCPNFRDRSLLPTPMIRNSSFVSSWLRCGVLPSWILAKRPGRIVPCSTPRQDQETLLLPRTPLWYRRPLAVLTPA